MYLCVGIRELVGCVSGEEVGIEHLSGYIVGGFFGG
jgi:hypothetical protein